MGSILARPRRPRLSNAELAAANYIVDGNSQDAGSNGAPQTSSYAARAGALLGVTLTNIAVGGQTTEDMRGRIAAQFTPALETGLNILVAAETRNYIVDTAVSGNLSILARTAVNNFWSLCADYREALSEGETLRIITHDIFDCTRTNNAVGITAIRALFAEANEYIQAEWHHHCDGFFSVQSDPRLLDADDSTYFFDQVHQTNANDVIVAAMLAQAIRNQRV